MRVCGCAGMQVCVYAAGVRVCGCADVRACGCAGVRASGRAGAHVRVQVIVTKGRFANLC